MSNAHLIGDRATPEPHERAALNTALHATGAETGFWDEDARPAPWPADIDEWTPTTSRPTTPEPGQHPF
jgi:hypothetical protein